MPIVGFKRNSKILPQIRQVRNQRIMKKDLEFALFIIEVRFKKVIRMKKFEQFILNNVLLLNNRIKY